MLSEKSVVHFIHPYLTKPSHDITVNVIGCGGTGSKFLTNLAMINQARIARQEIGLNVRVFDPDVVTESNVGRQVFSPADIGANKAEIAVSRINRFYGFSWASVPEKYDFEFVNSFWSVGGAARGNITVTCTDTIQSRREVKKILKIKPENINEEEYKPLYWLDIGNMQKSGQVVLSTVNNVPQPKTKMQPVNKLRDIFELFPEYEGLKDDDNIPSCSMAESLARQDLFINTLVADYAATLLWEFLRHGTTYVSGYFINTKSTLPIYLWHKQKPTKK
jgi:PRTRC genetic system ThiF family protein